MTILLFVAQISHAEGEDFAIPRTMTALGWSVVGSGAMLGGLKLEESGATSNARAGKYADLFKPAAGQNGVASSHDSLVKLQTYKDIRITYMENQTQARARRLLELEAQTVKAQKEFEAGRILESEYLSTKNKTQLEAHMIQNHRGKVAPQLTSEYIVAIESKNGQEMRALRKKLRELEKGGPVLVEAMSAEDNMKLRSAANKMRFGRGLFRAGKSLMMVTGFLFVQDMVTHYLPRNQIREMDQVVVAPRMSPAGRDKE